MWWTLWLRFHQPMLRPPRKFGDQDADGGVGVEVVRYAHVAGVVGGED